jgi:hypothetical protein
MGGWIATPGHHVEMKFATSSIETKEYSNLTEKKAVATGVHPSKAGNTYRREKKPITCGGVFNPLYHTESRRAMGRRWQGDAGPEARARGGGILPWVYSI